jgi:MYXO-CTERM domain-containing protein
MDPKPGADLLGWGVGQRLAYDWYEYNAKTGTVTRKYGNSGADLARGTCGDVDPTHPGYECWTGGKVFNMLDLTGAQIGSDAPAQNFRIWWDGDVLSENLDSNTVSKWAYPGMPSGGFTSANLAGLVPARNAAPLYGDMFGDWREEVLFEQSGGTSIRIYTTAIPTDKRIYTLVHDPEYRNSMCEKGYQQSHMLDYYLGDGMADPPKPNITYPSATGGSGAGGSTGAAGSGGGGTTGAAGASGGATSASAGASGGGATVVGGATGGGGTSESAGASGGGATSASAGASGSGATSASAGAGGGGALATSGAGAGGSGGKSATGGIPAGGGGGAGTVAAGGTSAPVGTLGTGSGVGGNPVTGGSTSVVAGGAGAPAASTTAVAGTSGSASSAAGGAIAGQSGTAKYVVQGSPGCSCGIGGTSERASAGSFFAMLGLLGLIAHRRHRRVSLRK